MGRIADAVARGLEIGQRARQARQEDEFNSLRLSEAYAARDERDRNRREMGYYRQTGDLSALQRAAPDAAAGIQKQQLEARRAQIDEAGALSQIEERNRGATESRAKLTDEWRARAGTILQQDPSQAVNLRAHLGKMADRGLIDAIDIPDASGPGPATPDTFTGAQMQVLGGAKQDAAGEQQAIFQQAAVAFGFNPQDPAALKDERVQRLIRKRLESSGGTTINVGGGRDLPAAQASELGDSQAALAAIDNMERRHLEAFGDSNGAVDRIVNFGQSLIPGSAEDIYEKSITADVQTVGTYLGRGVLQEPEYRRIKGASGGAGDGRAAAKAKFDAMRKAVRDRDEAQRGALDDAGFGGTKARPTGRRGGETGKTQPGQITIDQKLSQVDAAEKSGEITKAEANELRAIAKGSQ